MSSRTSPLRFHCLQSVFTVLMLFVSGIAPLAAQPAAVKAQTGTGIHFTDASWKEVLKQAKASDKLIFVDCYTTWCGPCSYMSKFVFTDESLGKLFNSRFISVKMNMESDAGLEFDAVYDIPAYPTLFIIDGKGKVVSKEVGRLEVDGLRKFAERGLALQQKMAGVAVTPKTTITYRALSWKAVKLAAQQEGKLIFIDEHPYDSAGGYLQPFYYDSATVARLNREFICWKYVAPGATTDSSGTASDAADPLYLNSHAGYGSWNHFYTPEGSPLMTWDSNSDAAAMANMFEQLQPGQEFAKRYTAIYPLSNRYANGETQTGFLKTYYAALDGLRREATDDALVQQFFSGNIPMQYHVARQLLRSAGANDLQNDTVFRAFTAYCSFGEDHQLIVAFADQYRSLSKRHPAASRELAANLYEVSFYHLSEYVNKPLADAVRKLTATVFEGDERSKNLASFDEMIRNTEQYNGQ